MSKITQHNAVVFGVSADTVESHKGFAAKEHLNFPLLADPDKQMIAAYGVLNKAGYADRVTFIIGPDGNIREIDRAVNAEFAREGTNLTSRHGTDLALLTYNWRAQIGKSVPNFSLPGIDGKPVSLFSPGKKAVAAFFFDPRSPASSRYANRMRALADDPAYKDVAFVGIDTNPAEKADLLNEESQLQQYPYPVARDEQLQATRHFRVTVLPTVWVMDGKGIAVYYGAIDDNPDPARVKVHYMKDALDAALASRPVSVSETRPSGDPMGKLPRK